MHAKECDLCRDSIPDVSCSRNACTVYIMSSKFEPHDRPIYIRLVACILWWGNPGLTISSRVSGSNL